MRHLPARVLLAALLVLLGSPAAAASPALPEVAAAPAAPGAPVTPVAVTPRPPLVVQTLVSGLSIPWDLAFTPDGTMLFTQRGGSLRARLPNGAVNVVSADLSDLFVASETGLMGIAIDPSFAGNRRFYTCQAHQAGGSRDVRVIAWTIDAGYSAATRVANPLLSGLPVESATPGRHTGCRLRFDPTGALLVAAGDSATGSTPQDLTSLGGKVLRIDPSTGNAAAGNPFSGSGNANTRRIYTYGHRNPQGLAIRPGSGQVWEVEHGTGTDDEINLLSAGANYGWDPYNPSFPSPHYDESNPMTDLGIPGAVGARWSSGSPTLATSGATFLSGSHWGGWNGALAVATLKDSALRIFAFDGNGNLTGTDIATEVSGPYGRLRTAQLGPDGALYLTTSNGGGTDRILRVMPESNPFGALDSITRVPGGLRVRGWTIDPDTTSALTVHVSHNGSILPATADRDRPDVGAAFPAFGSAHGFDVTLAVSSAGAHQICVNAINQGSGSQHTSLGCRALLVSTAPTGNVDALTPTIGGANMRGWAIDPDTTASAGVLVVVDGVAVGELPANQFRPDIADAYPGWGAAHGFGGFVRMAGGRHLVCGVGVNEGPGALALLGCGFVAVGSDPAGNFDGVTPGSGGFSFWGWAIDPDTQNPIDVHIYVDGVFAGNLGSAQQRPDVAAVHPWFGANHGYHGILSTSPGPHTACIYGINLGPGTANTLLGCRSFST